MNALHSMSLKLKLMLLLVPVFITGCGSIPKTEHYDLHCEPQTPVPESSRISAAIAVRPFSAVESYSRPHIAYRESRYRLHYDNYRQWTAPPAQLTHNVFTQCLRYSELFSTVVTGSLPGQYQYQVYGRVLEFYELNRAQEKYAVVHLELTCTDLNGKALFTIAPRIQVKAPDSSDLSGLAQAMSDALKKACDQFVDTARQTLQARDRSQQQ